MHPSVMDQEGIECGEFIALGDRGRVQRRWLINYSPLFPDPVGVGRLVGDRPVQVPEACIARRLIQKPHDNEIVIAHGIIRQFVG